LWFFCCYQIEMESIICLCFWRPFYARKSWFKLNLFMEIEICISVWFDLIFEVFFGFILLLVDQGFAVYFFFSFLFLFISVWCVLWNWILLKWIIKIELNWFQFLKIFVSSPWFLLFVQLLNLCLWFCNNTGQNIRKLVKDGFIIRKPTKIHSRSRARRMKEAKRKGRHSGYGT